VIWALGASMIALAGLIYLPYKAVMAVGIVMVVGHNLLDSIRVEGNTVEAFIWSLTHQQNFFTWNDKMVLVGYPLIPWIGVMALGYCLGKLFTAEFSSEARKRILIPLGTSMILLFIILRATNFYGDPSPWTSQSSSLFSFLSFLNTTKYPPSLLYLLMTIGPALLFLAFTEKTSNVFTRIVSVYGRVPLFYYVIHVYVLHLLAMLAAEFSPGYDWSSMILIEPIWFQTAFKGYGFSLAIVYLIWIAIVVSLYFPCRWYDRYKQTHKEKWWLSYL
jgi:uncharacterized membrane protein